MFLNHVFVCILHIHIDVHILYTSILHTDYYESVYVYRFCSHEQEIGDLAKGMGFSNVSLSSQIMPMIRIVPRGYTGMGTLLQCIYM